MINNFDFHERKIKKKNYKPKFEINHSLLKGKKILSDSYKKLIESKIPCIDRRDFDKKNNNHIYNMNSVIMNKTINSFKHKKNNNEFMDFTIKKSVFQENLSVKRSESEKKLFFEDKSLKVKNLNSILDVNVENKTKKGKIPICFKDVINGNSQNINNNNNNNNNNSKRNISANSIVIERKKTNSLSYQKIPPIMQQVIIKKKIKRKFPN